MPHFQINKEWLLPEEKVRLAEFHSNELLFKSDFKPFRETFIHPRQNEKERNDKWLQVAAGLPRLISKAYADFLFNEPPLVETTENVTEIINDELFNDVFLQKLYSNALVQSYSGGAVMKLFQDEDRDFPTIGFTHPRHFFPQFDPLDCNKITSVKFIFEFHVEELQKGETLLFVEEYFVDCVENRLFIVKGEKIVREIELGIFFPSKKEVQPMPLGKIPVYYVPNFTDGLEFWGKSDYEGLEMLFLAINRRLTVSEHGLEVHGGGKLAVGSGLLDEFGKPLVPSWEYYEVPSDVPNAMKPEFIQPKLSTMENIEQVKEYVKLALLTAELSPSVFGMWEGKLPTSGKALKMEWIRTLTAAARKAMRWELSLKEAGNDWLALANISGEVLSVKLQDGIPEFPDEVIERELMKKEGGLQTTAQAIAKVDGIPEKDAEEKLVKIRADQVSQRDATGSVF